MGGELLNLCILKTQYETRILFISGTKQRTIAKSTKILILDKNSGKNKKSGHEFVS